VTRMTLINIITVVTRAMLCRNTIGYADALLIRAAPPITEQMIVTTPIYLIEGEHIHANLTGCVANDWIFMGLYGYKMTVEA